MSTSFSLSATVREQFGTSASRRMRREEDIIPAVIYGGDREPLHITLNHKELMKALESEAFHSQIITLNMGDKEQKVVLKSLERHPTKARAQHADFLRVNADEKITMSIPIHLMGQDDAPGTKLGGVFSQNMNDIEISCLPGDLPSHIELDVSSMDVGQTLHMTDVKLPSGVTPTADLDDDAHNHPVVSLSVPQEEPEPTEEVLEEGTEEGEAQAEGDTDTGSEKE